ncbi:MAG: hypothetical protein F2923_01410 [Actinobacteria bacterium]|uniref:Unannotated protein n=1 Tax=freshwater metagenome TaxID=449393 RepID=A0A6J7F762_9ZZZZ|nr:hypothetical protein [Actinomycetota bacterium]MTB27277.1 hypothetical protein [Actinomycetota bacterium]
MTIPRSYLALAFIAGLEGAALLATAVVSVVQALSGTSYGARGDDSSAIILEVVIFTVFGLGLLVVAKGWYSRKRWARSPFVLAQLLGLAIGIWSDTQLVLRLGFILPAVLGLIITFSPAVLRDSSQAYKS